MCINLTVIRIFSHYLLQSSSRRQCPFFSLRILKTTRYLPNSTNSPSFVAFYFQLGKLPPVLYIQMDNCYRECKNKYVLGFLSILVEMQIFRKVMSFLLSSYWHVKSQIYLVKAARFVVGTATTLNIECFLRCPEFTHGQQICCVISHV